MRLITKKIVGAFINRQVKNLGSTKSTGTELFLHGNKIAEWRENNLWITAAGWMTSTTKERLNGLPGVSICQKDGLWFLNGKLWDGEWRTIYCLYNFL